MVRICGYIFSAKRLIETVTYLNDAENRSKKMMNMYKKEINKTATIEM